MSTQAPVRQVVLDTETTGLAADDGHRVIEIGCVELINRRLTGRTFHHYFDPERDIDVGASEVHGLTREMLAGKPRFADLADEIAAFVDGAEVLIHNAPFDVGFLDAEFARLGGRRFVECCALVSDTLAMARELHPGRRNSLDALCDRYGVSNAHRKLHGALLDAELLADVYLAMTRGQDSLEIATLAPQPQVRLDGSSDWPPEGLVVVSPDAHELAAHAALLAGMAKEGKPPLWQAEASGPATGS